MLVAPVVEKGATTRRVYLPRGTWFDFWTEERIDGGREIDRAVDLATMPLYVRAGAIIPMGPVKQYTSEPSDEPLTLVVYPGADGASSWYEDDGTIVRLSQWRVDARADDVARRIATAVAAARAGLEDACAGDAENPGPRCRLSAANDDLVRREADGRPPGLRGSRGWAAARPANAHGVRFTGRAVDWMKAAMSDLNCFADAWFRYAMCPLS